MTAKTLRVISLEGDVGGYENINPKGVYSVTGYFEKDSKELGNSLGEDLREIINNAFIEGYSQVEAIEVERKQK